MKRWTTRAALIALCMVSCGDGESNQPDPKNVTPNSNATTSGFRSVVSEHLATLCFPAPLAPSEQAMTMEQVEPLLRSWMGSDARFAKIAL